MTFFLEALIGLTLGLGAVLLVYVFVSAIRDPPVWAQVMNTFNAQGETFVSGWDGPMGQYLYDTRSRVVLTREDGTWVAFIVTWHDQLHWLAVPDLELTVETPEPPAHTPGEGMFKRGALDV